MDTEFRGRKLANWVREDLHRQGDGYLVGIYFFVHEEPQMLKEGLDAITWSLEQAVILGGCGRHVIPHEEIARKQITALGRHRKILPRALRRIELSLKNRSLSEQQIQRIIYDTFVEILTEPTTDAIQLSTSFQTEDALHLTNYFMLGLGTLKRVFKV